MRNPSRYKFHNVLVADTRVLVPMATGAGSQPQPNILVLTSKLYKCEPHQANCTSCCLHIEQPEFRRRTLALFDDSDSTGAAECFADCGRRRSVDVELNSRVQLNGKLVILAISKLDHLFAAPPGSPTKCQTVNTWSYSKFDPNHSSPTTNAPKQASYSRFSSSQLPSMLIESVDISRDPDSLKELISLTIKPNHHQRLYNHHHHDKQQVVNPKETLLVSELDCYQSSVDSGQPVASLFDESDLQLTTHKVHLLALINRQLSSHSRSMVEDDLRAQQGRGSRLVKVNVPPPRLLDLAPESYIDYPAAASSHAVGGRTASSIPSTVLTRARSLNDGASQHNHKPTITSTTTTTTRRPNLSTGVLRSMHVPFLHNKYEFKTNESSRMGPSFVLEHDLTRARLKPSGFIVLAISSSLVILTYTLCLIAYLRWRHKIRAKNRTTSKSNDGAVVPIQRVELDISQPYNLQMPSATRTRLEMMLRRSVGGNGNSEAGLLSPGLDSSNTRSLDRLRLAERRRRKNRLMANNNHNQGKYDSVSPHQQYKLSQLASGDDATGGGGGQYARYNKQRHMNIGSINVVRAIRQAATLARSRLHLHSRYRPNLNVIFESDLEYLQSPRGEIYRGLFDHNNLVYISPHGLRPEAHFDTLVQDAMRTDCSHYIDRLTSQTQATATLFSKPIEETNPLHAVSRSKILRQVKQEDIFGNQDSERAEI